MIRSGAVLNSLFRLDSGVYDHSVDDDDQRLRLMAHEDVKVVLRVRRLMFSDNTVLEPP